MTTVEIRVATQRAADFAAPLLRVEAGFAKAILAAHLRAIGAMRPVVEDGGAPDAAGRAAFASLHPALARLGRAWLPRIMREGWAQGTARLRAAVARARSGKASPDVSLFPEFGEDWPGIAEYLLNRPVTYAPIAAQTTVDMFRAHLIAGSQDGLGIDAIVRSILGEQLPGISRYRAELIARTEVLSAGNAANLANYRASSVVEKKAWISTKDARTRESHRTEKWPANRRVVPLDQPFVLPSGARLMYPGDTSLGASASEWANCRCALAPEVSLPGLASVNE